MKKDRFLILAALVIGGWVLFIAYSLRRVGDLFEGSGFPETQNAEIGIETQPTTISPEENAPAATVTSATEVTDDGGLSEADVTAVTLTRTEPANVSWVAVPAEQRCRYAGFSGFVAVRTNGSEISLPFGFHMSLSDSALRDRADSDEDGLAQYVYAHRILGFDSVPGNVFVAPEDVIDRFDSTDDEDFQLATEYMISAVRNDNWGAAKRLASIYFPFDKVEAHAWLLIDAMAGGNGLQLGSPLPGSGPRNIIVEALDALTDEEKAVSFARAGEIVTEFELTEGLLPLAGCEGIAQP